MFSYGLKVGFLWAVWTQGMQGPVFESLGLSTQDLIRKLPYIPESPSLVDSQKNPEPKP